jgi:hypothetical protein
MQPISFTLETNLSQIWKCWEELRHFQERDTLEDNYTCHSLRMNLKKEDELHSTNPVSFIFDVEISFHVCSFYHGFGHLLTNYRIKVELGLPIAFPP